MAKARITLIGCGFAGISLGLASKRKLGDVEVIGHDKDRDAMRNAEVAGAVDRTEWNLPKACENAAAVFIAIPPDGLDLTLKSIAPELLPNALVVIFGGSNVSALNAARETLSTEVSVFASTLVYHPDRVSAAMRTPEPESLNDAMWTIAPRPGTGPDMVDGFVALVAELGAKPIFVDPAERDGMAIAIDALPSLLGSALMLAVSGDGAWRERQWMAGAAFGDATAGALTAERFAALAQAQPEAATHWLNQVMLQCMALRDAIRERDTQALAALLERSKERHEQWLADWRKGRLETTLPVERPHSVLNLFVGERMAGRLAGGKKR